MDKKEPLAERMRPINFDQFFGQSHLVSKNQLLRKLADKDQLSSVIFWGPPGVGKTTLAYIIARQTKSHFIPISAVSSGKKELMKIIKKAQDLLNNQTKTILFIDEIHRWSKSQQDALLPYVERGDITLIGATTENPSFEIINALLSRSQVFVLQILDKEDIIRILNQALQDMDRGFGSLSISIKPETIELLSELSAGDARRALNGLDLAVRTKFVDRKKKIQITNEDIKEALQRTHLIFDKQGEAFYNLISALHKSMRGGDANAALYWLARMLEGGADPLYIARRVLRFACEDVGMANAEALVQANAVYDACHKIGMPECGVHLAQAVVYCAKSKKSNLLYKAYEEAAMDARNTSQLGVPLHLRNAPTKLMKKLGYGQGYKYNPDYKDSVEQEYLPKELSKRNYFSSSPTRWEEYMKAQKAKKKNK